MGGLERSRTLLVPGGVSALPATGINPLLMGRNQTFDLSSSSLVHSSFLSTNPRSVVDTRRWRAEGRRSQAVREEEAKETLVDGAEISFAPVAKDHKKTRGGGEKTERRGGLVPLQE